LIDHPSARTSVEHESIAEDGVERQESLRAEYAPHEEGTDGAVGGAVIGAAVGAVVAGPVGAAVGALIGVAAGDAAGEADQKQDHRDADGSSDDLDR
jgi:phage tail tape-measure protein